MSGGDEPWHLDKRVPVALIVTILIQTAAAVWWASETTQRLDTLERTATALAESGNSKELRIRAIELAAGRTDEKLVAIQATLARIERLLEGRPQ